MLHFGTAALGSLLGSSVGIGSRTGWMLGNLVASRFFGKEKLEGKRLDDLSVQTSTYGAAIPIIYGRAMLKGNIIWTSGIKETSKTTKERVNILTKVSVKDYLYHVDLAIGLCEGETSGLLRIWANDQLIYDATPGNTGTPKALPFTHRFYTGSEDQLPDGLIAASQKNAPAFRGLSYVVFDNFPLEEFNNKLPHFTFEVSRNIAPQTRMIEVPDAGPSPDNICWAAESPWLFLRENNRIIAVDRTENKVSATFDTTPDLPRTEMFASCLFGSLCFDSTGGNLYAFAQQQLSSFILKIDPLTGRVLAHNFEQRLVADESIGFVDGPLLYTADFLKGTIRVYQASDLTRLYEIPGCLESGLHQRPCNFTKDAAGRIWLATYNPLNNNEFYLTRVRGQGDVKHFTYATYGQASGIVFDKATGTIVVKCSTGLLMFDPETGAILRHMPEVASFANSFANSTFLNHPIVDGQLWLAKDGAAICVDLPTRKIQQTVMFAASFHGAVFDPEQLAIWYKAGTLCKLLLGRSDPVPLTLPHVVNDVLQRCGYDAMELQVDLKPDPVHGLIIPHPMTGRSALGPLARAHFFYTRSHAARLQCFYVQDNQAVTADSSHAEAFDERRREDIIMLREPVQDLPSSLELFYPSVERHYGMNVQKARVHAGQGSQALQLDLPLLLRDAEAQNIAKKLLHLAWQRRSSIMISLLPRYGILEVGDRLLLAGKQIVITQLTHTPTDRIEVEGWVEG